MILGKQAWHRIQHSQKDSEKLPRDVSCMEKEENEMSSFIGGCVRVRYGIHLCEARRQFSRAAVHTLFLSLQLASRATTYPMAFVLECVHGLFLSLVVL